MKQTIINGIKFTSKKDVLAYSKKIMEKYVNAEIVGEDLDFMWELIIQNYPNPDAKKLHIANKITVKLTENYGRYSLWIWVIDNNGKEHDVSLHKSINNLKWEIAEVPDDFIEFGKYKNKTVSEVINADISYFQWLLEQTWLREGLRTTIINCMNENKGEDESISIDMDLDYEPPF